MTHFLHLVFWAEFLEGKCLDFLREYPVRLKARHARPDGQHSLPGRSSASVVMEVDGVVPDSLVGYFRFRRQFDIEEHLKHHHQRQDLRLDSFQEQSRQLDSFVKQAGVFTYSPLSTMPKWSAVSNSFRILLAGPHKTITEKAHFNKG